MKRRKNKKLYSTVDEEEEMYEHERKEDWDKIDRWLTMVRYKLKARKVSDEATIVQDETGQKYILKPKKVDKDDGTMNFYFSGD